MFKCPNCREYLGDDETWCANCGKRISDDIPKPAGEPKPEARPAAVEAPAKDVTRLTLTIFFLVLSTLGAILLVPSRNPQEFPIAPSALIVLSAFGVVLSLTLTRKGSKLRLPFLALCLPALLFGLYGFITGLASYNGYRRDVRLADQRKVKLEADRRIEWGYIKAHQEELYQEGLTLLKDQKYQEAKEKFSRILLPDGEYKDAADLLARAEEQLSLMELERRRTAAKADLDKAEPLLKSNSCRDYDLAIRYAQAAKAVQADEKRADRILLNAKLLRLLCFEGNDQIRIALKVEGYAPLKLYVWLRNVSTSYREANPGFFVLESVKGKTYRVSPKTYELGKFFDAVFLNPGAETSGSIIFDTYDKPKKLAYTETSGTSIVRELPFE